MYRGYLFTGSIPRGVAMNMAKSRDIQGKIPSPKVIGMDFDQVTVNGVNSNL